MPPGKPRFLPVLTCSTAIPVDPRSSVPGDVVVVDDDDPRRAGASEARSARTASAVSPGRAVMEHDGGDRANACRVRPERRGAPVGVPRAAPRRAERPVRDAHLGDCVLDAPRRQVRARSRRGTGGPPRVGASASARASASRARRAGRWRVRTSSGRPPMRDATTGTPERNASRITNGLVLLPDRRDDEDVKGRQRGVRNLGVLQGPRR